MPYDGPLRREVRDAKAIDERFEAREHERRRDHYGPIGAFWNNGPEWPFHGRPRTIEAT